MDENYQDKTGSKLIATEDKLWLPPLSSKDQKKLKRLQKKTFAEKMGFAGKSPWDLVQLLLIPLVLAAVSFGFSVEQGRISDANGQRQHDTDLQIATDQQREATLQTYIDHMSDLLLGNSTGKDSPTLASAKPSDEISKVARVRTLTALQQLDGVRKGLLLQFLYQAQLITNPKSSLDHSNPVISLADADLTGLRLQGTALDGLNWGCHSGGVSGSGGANLSNADLEGADLSKAEITCADLRGANLSGANLRGVDIFGSNLSHANLSMAHIGCVYQGPCSSISLDLSGANLHGADLSGADLSDVDLSRTDLGDAFLDDVNLDGANLSGANLKNARVTQEQLQKAKSLKGTIMPDGSKHP